MLVFNRKCTHQKQDIVWYFLPSYKRCLFHFIRDVFAARRLAFKNKRSWSNRSFKFRWARREQNIIKRKAQSANSAVFSGLWRKVTAREKQPSSVLPTQHPNDAKNMAVKSREVQAVDNVNKKTRLRRLKEFPKRSYWKWLCWNVIHLLF